MRTNYDYERTFKCKWPKTDTILKLYCKLLKKHIFSFKISVVNATIVVHKVTKIVQLQLGATYKKFSQREG